jgi:hypothetical protein
MGLGSFGLSLRHATTHLAENRETTMCETHAGHFEEAGVSAKDGVSAMTRRNLVRGLASGSIVLFAAGCETNAITGRSQLLLIDDAQLAQLSLSAWQQTKKETPLTKDAAAAARVTRVGQKIQRSAGYGGQQWEFATFESKEANAFVLPGGKVGVYKGLLDIASTDDQLAAVLGHETGHVSGRHSAERYSQSILADTGMQAAGALVKNPTTFAALGLGVQYGVFAFAGKRSGPDRRRLHACRRLQCERVRDALGKDGQARRGASAELSIHAPGPRRPGAGAAGIHQAEGLCLMADCGAQA